MTKETGIYILLVIVLWLQTWTLIYVMKGNRD